MNHFEHFPLSHVTGMTRLRHCFGLSLLLSTAMLCQAQQQPAGQSPPDAPSTTQSAQKPAPPPDPSKSHNTFTLLGRRSTFFPDLATSPGPLSSSQKFELFASTSISGSAVLGSAAGAGFSQAIDSYSGYGQGGEGYAKRFGASMARGATTNFFGTFLIPSLLHQDPRYFVLGDGSFRESAKYALRRVFITRTDSGGNAFNWSGILAPLASEGIANTYLPEGDRTAGQTIERYGTDIGVRAAGNLMREYWPTLSKKLKLPRKFAPAPTSPPPVADPKP